MLRSILRHTAGVGQFRHANHARSPQLDGRTAHRVLRCTHLISGAISRYRPDDIRRQGLASAPRYQIMPVVQHVLGFPR